MLNLVIQRRVEMGTLLQVFLGVGTGAGFFTGNVHAGSGWQGHGGGNGRSGDDGEEIQINVGDPCVRLIEWPGRPWNPTYARGLNLRNALKQ